MQSLLSPGIRLLGRFRFARKFQLLFLLFMLPLAASLYLLGQDYRSRLQVIAGERTGVAQLLALESADDQLIAQRNRAARWKAVDILHNPTQQALQAMDALKAATPALQTAVTQAGQALAASGASRDALSRYEKLKTATAGLDLDSLRSIGWWPDGYERFTAASATLQSVRDQLAMDRG